MPNNVCDLGKIIVATSFEWLPKVQKSPNLVTLIAMCLKLLSYVFMRAKGTNAMNNLS